MTNFSLLTLALIGGIVLGVLFFGGLWATVRMVTKAKVPAIWLLTSLLIRFLITLLGFYYIGAGSWKTMLTCALGFWIGRMIVFYSSKQLELKRIEPGKEERNEA